MHSWPIIILITGLSLLIGLIKYNLAKSEKDTSQAITMFLISYGLISSAIVVFLLFIWHIHPIWGEIIHFHPPQHITKIHLINFGFIQIDLFSALVVLLTIGFLGISFLYSQWRLRAMTPILIDNSDVMWGKELKKQFSFLNNCDVVVIEEDDPKAFSYSLFRPLNKTKVKNIIVISAGMIDLLNEEELETVLAHEYSHISEHDTRYAHVMITLSNIIKYDPILWLFKRFVNFSHEVAADYNSAKITKKPKSLASALLKFIESKRIQRTSDINRSILGSNVEAIKERIEILLSYSIEDLSSSNIEFNLPDS